MIFLLLPWLFAVVPPGFARPDQGTGEETSQVEPAIAGQPIHATAPIWVQYSPMPQVYIDAWLKKQYPGTAVTVPMLGTIATAAKKFNVNELILLGILNAEQGMLSRNLLMQDGMAHYLWALENPFDYGVWPGSPFKHDIGVLKSAEGAAADVAAVANGMPKVLWQQLGLKGFFLAMSGYFDNGNTAKIDPSWVANIASLFTPLSADLYNTASGRVAVAGAYQSEPNPIAWAGDAVVAVHQKAQGFEQWLVTEGLNVVSTVFTTVQSAVTSFLTNMGLPPQAVAVLALIIAAGALAGTALVA